MAEEAQDDVKNPGTDILRPEPKTAPQKRGLSGFALKNLAAASMLIDHTAAIALTAAALTAQGMAAGDAAAVYHLLRDLGRVAFPLFAFLCAQGILHTKNLSRYALRLLLFAVLSQLPFALAFNNLNMSAATGVWAAQIFSYLNVLFTLLFAAGGELLRRKIQARGLHGPVLYLPWLLAALTAELLQTDYGALGVLMVLCALGEGRWPRFWRMLTVTAALYVALPLWNWGFAAFLAAPWGILRTFLCAAASLGLILAYDGRRGDGRRGDGRRWFFYWFYPVHILALYILQQFM